MMYKGGDISQCCRAVSRYLSSGHILSIISSSIISASFFLCCSVWRLPGNEVSHLTASFPSDMWLASGFVELRRLLLRKKLGSVSSVKQLSTPLTRG